MARTRNSTPVNFFLVNFVELEEALKSARKSRIKKVYEETIGSLDHIAFEQKFYAMKGFSISEVDDNLVLFDLGEDKIIMSELFGNSLEIPKFDNECFADYQMFSSGDDDNKFNLIYSIFKESVIHPVYLFRYAELCQFELFVNDEILLRVLGDTYKDYLSDDEDEDAPPKKKKSRNAIDENNEYNRKLLDVIKKETCETDWDEKILESYREVLHLINPIDKDDIYSGSLDLRHLQHDHVLIVCILEFIGDVKTLFNFAITNRTFYELFKQTNNKNLLLKRIAKDWGLIFL